MALTLKLIAINNNPFLNPDYINHKRTDSETWNQAVSKTKHKESKRNHFNRFRPSPQTKKKERKEKGIIHPPQNLY